jgi:hypothetical protein
MPRLLQFPTAKQARPNSCWACAARLINNWFARRGEAGPNGEFASDLFFARAWAQQSGDPEHAKINVQQSAAAALESLGLRNSMDSAALPTPQEICEQIERGHPMLALVGPDAPDPSPNPMATQGHWIVIIGITITARGTHLEVLDPDDGLIHKVKYDPATYVRGSYWQNTSYVDEYKTEPLPNPSSETKAVIVRSSAEISLGDTEEVPPRTSESQSVPELWTGQARGGLRLQVRWQPTPDGHGVLVELSQSPCQGSYPARRAMLHAAHASSRQGTWQFGTNDSSFLIHITLIERPGPTANASGQMVLRVEYPKSHTRAAREVIATWPTSRGAVN